MEVEETSADVVDFLEKLEACVPWDSHQSVSLIYLFFRQRNQEFDFRDAGSDISWNTRSIFQ